MDHVGGRQTLGAARKLPDLMTVEEFFDWPGDREGTRYDLVDGVPRAHAAPSDEHGTIQARVAALLIAHIDKVRPECRVVVGSGIVPKFRAKWNFRQPDVTVTCKPNVKGHKAIPDPTVVIEILSPSNASDTWDNVRNYMTVPSVREIAIIHSTRVFAELLVRNADGEWPSDPVALKANDMPRLESLDFEMTVASAYRGTYLGG